jgi:hypothetical protein
VGYRIALFLLNLTLLEVILLVTIAPMTIIGAIGVPLLSVLYSSGRWVPGFTRPKKKIPGHSGVRYEGRWKPEEMKVAIDTFMNLWIDSVGNSPRFEGAFSKLDIRFTTSLVKLSTPVYLPDGRKSSLAWAITDSPRKIRCFDHHWFETKVDGETIRELFPLNDIKLWRTALGHELIHIALWNTTGDADFNHQTGQKGPWTEKHLFIEKEWRRKMRELNV